MFGKSRVWLRVVGVGGRGVLVVLVLVLAPSHLAMPSSPEAIRGMPSSQQPAAAFLFSTEIGLSLKG